MMASASKHSERFTGALLAILMQAGFIALFLHALPLMTPPKELAREITFILPPLVRTPPPKAEQSAAPRAAPAPVFVIPPMVISPPLPQTQSPSALQNFGHALFGCAPEAYANLPPEQKAHCQKPGEGVAILQAPDPLNTRSHVKDEAYWQEQFTEAHWMPADCTGVDLTHCQMADLHAEHQRAEKANALIAAKKAAALKQPELPLPERVGVHPH